MSFLSPSLGRCAAADTFPVISFSKTFDDAIPPRRFTPDSVGYDLYAPDRLEIPPGRQSTVDTGIVLRMDPLPDSSGLHTYAQLLDKSSVCGLKRVVVDGGVIDPGYRGSIRVVLRNIDERATALFQKGDPIAQMVFPKVLIPTLKEEEEEEEEEMDEERTIRGTRGFGGTLFS